MRCLCVRLSLICCPQMREMLPKTVCAGNMRASSLADGFSHPTILSSAVVIFLYLFELPESSLIVVLHILICGLSICRVLKKEAWIYAEAR
jgi:hypothetical protein